MDTMVSARMPVELKERVHTLLKEQGSSPTEFIRRSYEVFAQTGVFPAKPAPLRSGKRTLTPEQSTELLESIRKSTCAIPGLSSDPKMDDALLSQALEDEYEALA